MIEQKNRHLEIIIFTSKKNLYETRFTFWILNWNITIII